MYSEKWGCLCCKSNPSKYRIDNIESFFQSPSWDIWTHLCRVESDGATWIRSAPIRIQTWRLGLIVHKQDSTQNDIVMRKLTRRAPLPCPCSWRLSTARSRPARTPPWRRQLVTTWWDPGGSARLTAAAPAHCVCTL